MDVHIRKHIKADEKLIIANIKITCKRLVNSIYKGTSLKILSNFYLRFYLIFAHNYFVLKC